MKKSVCHLGLINKQGNIKDYSIIIGRQIVSKICIETSD